MLLGEFERSEQREQHCSEPPYHQRGKITGSTNQGRSLETMRSSNRVNTSSKAGLLVPLHSTATSSRTAQSPEGMLNSKTRVPGYRLPETFDKRTGFKVEDFVK
jgi:hypothetical protein